MNKVYLFRYIIYLFCFEISCTDRIDQYYQLRAGMEKYLELLKKNIGDKASSTLHLDCYDNAQKGIKSTSEFLTGCITNTITLSDKPKPVVKMNAIMQLLIVTYGFINNLYEIFYKKKEQKLWLASLNYTDVVIKFPHLILIEFQIKIMKLLIEMNVNGHPAERAFARIHLASMILPGSYENFSKKLSKKIYKKYFDKDGCLLNLESFDEAKIYRDFFKKISYSWQDLLLQVHKFPTEFNLFYDSIYKNKIFENEYNLKVLKLIEAGRSQNKETLNLLMHESADIIFTSIYEFYCNQN